MIYGRIGCIGRWKPPHLGSQALLEAVCGHALEAVIGVGSANKYNSRNPFTAEETRQMIECMLAPRFSNYKLIMVPDFAPQCTDGSKWVDYIREHFGKLDCFITGNPYVASLMQGTYRVVNSFEISPRENSIRVKATMVRLAMAKSEQWEHLIPAPVADYVKKHGLDRRLRKEFGPEIMSASPASFRFESQLEEKIHTYQP
jgi:nicotinamide-nucleotide adenylyltransferase